LPCEFDPHFFLEIDPGAFYVVEVLDECFLGDPYAVILECLIDALPLVEEAGGRILRWGHTQFVHFLLLHLPVDLELVPEGYQGRALYPSTHNFYVFIFLCHI